MHKNHRRSFRGDQDEKLSAATTSWRPMFGLLRLKMAAGASLTRDNCNALNAGIEGTLGPTWKSTA